jgi:isoquinoline 1-oxidoreductase alpha subunit
MIMAVSALLEQRPDPSDEQIDATITNICRCGTFARVRRAIHRIADGEEGRDA